MSAPRATVRLQLHAGFTLSDAQAQVPYYAKLGISHLYLSPISQARRGSMHGYDVVSHETVSDELGGEPALIALVQSLRAHDMGVILDIVPNHMATDPANRWWWDVLKHGRNSAYSQWFDIDWQSPVPGLQGRVLAPFLGEDYGRSLDDGTLQLVFDDALASFQIQAGVTRYPVAPGTLREEGISEQGISKETSDSDGLANRRESILAAYNPTDPEGRLRLHELLERQHYRLSWWRCAADSINWRRFFEVSELIGVRVECPDVFDAVHALPLRLFAQGLVDGLRIDHVDGLAQPLAYCRQLTTALKARCAQRPGNLRDDEPWLVVEKILAHGETLDARWDVDGTSGYDFMDQAGAALHDPQGESPLTAHWNALSENASGAPAMLRQACRLMLQRHFSAERWALLRTLSELAQSDPGTRDWSIQTIARVLDGVLEFFPVYRNYVEVQTRDAVDQALFTAVLEQVRARLHRDRDGQGLAMLDVLDDWLGGKPARSELADLQQRAIRRFQQLTPPLAAKSLEDTTFYRYGRLISRNEVGSDPAFFCLSADDFHRRNSWRAAHGARSMLATATHDHKRGEDVRARLAVLSEQPQAWVQASQRWLHWPGMGEAIKSGVQAGERYMLLQTIVGAWPLDMKRGDQEACRGYVERIIQWQTKALREGKQSSSWFEPDLQYEQASADYVRDILLGEQEDLAAELEGFVEMIAAAGAVNSLAQAVLRMTSPGIPDLYQGTEFWDFSLVDPDNRCAVDFAARRRALDDCIAGRETVDLVADWRRGHIKQAVVFRTLQLRRQLPEVFDKGKYVPLPLVGPRSAHALAFLRRLEDRYVVVVVPRFISTGLSQAGGKSIPMVAAEFWDGTAVVLPSEYAAIPWRDVLCDQVRRPGEGGVLLLADLFAGLSVALLVCDQAACDQG